MRAGASPFRPMRRLPSTRQERCAGRNSPNYMLHGTQTLQLLTDQLGSLRAVVDTATGNVVQRMQHDEFGNVVEDTNPGFVPFGFAGGIYDADTGLVRFGARDYDPVVGRWISKDPIRFGGGQANLYAYLNDDPVNSTDSGGRAKDPECVARVDNACETGCAKACSPGVCTAICQRAAEPDCEVPDPKEPDPDEPDPSCFEYGGDIYDNCRGLGQSISTCLNVFLTAYYHCINGFPHF
jgi:RHS repeat-associated protein